MWFLRFLNMKKIRFFIFDKCLWQKEFFLCEPTEPFIKIFLCSRGTVKLFFVWKKSYKRSKQAWAAWAPAAHQLCRSKFFCFREYSASEFDFSNTQSQEVGNCRFTNRRIRFDGRVRVGATSREPRNATLCGNAFHDSWELSLVWEQVGASTNLRTFPHHDLAPNGLLQGWQRKFRRTAKKGQFHSTRRD